MSLLVRAVRMPPVRTSNVVRSRPSRSQPPIVVDQPAVVLLTQSWTDTTRTPTPIPTRLVVRRPRGSRPRGPARGGGDAAPAGRSVADRWAPRGRPTCELVGSPTRAAPGLHESVGSGELADLCNAGVARVRRQRGSGRPVQRRVCTSRSEAGGGAGPPGRQPCGRVGRPRGAAQIPAAEAGRRTGRNCRANFARPKAP